jgi:hypothetical protein
MASTITGHCGRTLRGQSRHSRVNGTARTSPIHPRCPMRASSHDRQLRMASAPESTLICPLPAHPSGQIMLLNTWLQAKRSWTNTLKYLPRIVAIRRTDIGADFLTLPFSLMAPNLYGGRKALISIALGDQMCTLQYDCGFSAHNGPHFIPAYRHLRHDKHLSPGAISPPRRKLGPTSRSGAACARSPT